MLLLYIAMATYNSNPSSLGGGYPGIAPPLLGGGAGSTGSSGVSGGGPRGTNRDVLRRAFGNIQYFQAALPGVRSRTTPFRLAFNAGDVNGSHNSSPLPQLPGSNQINGTMPANKINRLGDGTHNDGEAAFSGNPRYVYDGSDYVRFKKLQAMNRNYNDRSFGGDQFAASFAPLNFVRS